MILLLLVVAIVAGFVAYVTDPVLVLGIAAGAALIGWVAVIASELNWVAALFPGRRGPAAPERLPLAARPRPVVRVSLSRLAAAALAASLRRTPRRAAAPSARPRRRPDRPPAPGWVPRSAVYRRRMGGHQ